MNLLRTIFINTTSYHPQANGLIERFHHRLKGDKDLQLNCTTLHLPGEFMFPSSSSSPDYMDYITSFMVDLKAIPPRTVSTYPSFVHHNLMAITHVFVRRDLIKKPLQHPHNGPYKALKSTDKLNGQYQPFKTSIL